MLEFYAHHYYFMAKKLQWINNIILSNSHLFSSTLAQSSNEYTTIKNAIIVFLADTVVELDVIGLTLSAKKAKELIRIIQSSLHSKNQMDQIANGLEELSQRVQDELEDSYLLHLTDNEAALYKSANPLLGEDVQSKFTDILYDIDEAAKCAGLARYTASVFHLMRVMEFGVQKFGAKLGVTLIDPVNGKQKLWQNILNECNKAIKELPQHDQSTKNLASISSNLYSVKLAWRNEVMHPKATYTEEEARNIILAVKAFMSELASVV